MGPFSGVGKGKRLEIGSVIRGFQALRQLRIEAKTSIEGRLPEDHDEKAIVEECRRRRVAMSSIDEFFTGPSAGPPTLLLGYSQSTEATIRAGVAEVAAAIEVSRRSRR